MADAGKPHITEELPNVIRVYSDGRVERLMYTDYVPPSENTTTGVVSKDVLIATDPNIPARLYIPELANPDQKLPLLVYFHGGAFCVGSPFAATYHEYLNAVVAESQVIAVSVGYRKAPEHPIPTAYDDSLLALQWIGSHLNRNGPDPWLNQHVDFDHVFLAGDSAGANIAHNLAVYVGSESETRLGFQILGVALVHPYFWGTEPIGSEQSDPNKKAIMDRIWPFVHPENPDNDDPLLNPIGSSIVCLGCRRVMVCVAEKDVLRDRAWLFYNALSKSGWLGVVEITETEGEDHAFHLRDLASECSKNLIRDLAFFFNRDAPPISS